MINKTKRPAQGDKPRICEILGVGVGEEFKVKGSEDCYRVNEHGVVERSNCHYGIWYILQGALPYQLINDPSAIIYKPKFTDEEMTVLRYAFEHGAKTISREGGYGLYQNERGCCNFIPVDWFSSIKPGDTIDLEEMFGGEDT